MATPKTAPTPTRTASTPSPAVNLGDFKTPAEAPAPAADTALQVATPIEAKLAAGRAKTPTFTTRKSMNPGDSLDGVFLGLGDYVWVPDPNDPTKENRIATWLIQVGAYEKTQINSSSQLDDKLAKFPIGDYIAIALKMEKGRSRAGRQFNDFIISDPESNGGKFLEAPHTVLEPVQKRSKAV